ncbi:MAG: M1 family peptidase [Sphingobacteriales bacterium]|nr:M1 family peptidase [Sphingobacteriales bacterium]
MRLLLVAGFLLLISFCRAQSKFDVLHYKYSLELSDNNDTIFGQAAINLKLLAEADVIKFDLVTQTKRSKGMIIDKISGPGIRGFVKEPDSVRIMLAPNSLTKGDTATYIVTYHGIPADGLIISKNKYGKRTFFSDNWPNRAHNWIPCVDDPSDKASMEFIVTAPAHYQVVSNGIKMEETNLPGNKKLTHWKEDVPLPTKVMVIGMADFAVDTTGEINAVPVYSYVFPENKTDGFYDYALAKDILSFFINYIGPYPYKKLANVQSKTIFGGMENAGAIFYHENSVDGKRTEEGLFAHEIVHQWFGDMATEKNFAHIWLSEGFATYLTHLYYESKYGVEVFNQRMLEDKEAIIDFVRSARKPVVDSVSPYMQLLSANSYQRGSWVLHMLRSQLGDSVFHKGIREYYEEYKGKNANTEDFEAILEKVSGKKLDTFFRQWLYRPGIPQLSINWKYNIKEKNVTVTVTQLQKDSLFQFPLDIFIHEPRTVPRMVRKQVQEQVQTFVFPVKTRPTVRIDPFISLLYEGSVLETK